VLKPAELLGMQPVTAIAWGGMFSDALLGQIQRIAQQWTADLSQVDADLVGAAGVDHHVQPVADGGALQQADF
jgi:hypothetical protein